MVMLNLKRLSRQSLIFLFDLSALLITWLVLSVVPVPSVSSVVSQDSDAVRGLLLVFLVWLSAYICGFYSLNALRIDLRALKPVAINKAIDAVLFFFLFLATTNGPFPWQAYLLWMATYTVAFVALRIAAKYIYRHSKFRVPICFLVDHPAVGEIIDEFVYNPQVGYAPAFVLSSNGGECARGKVKVLHDEHEALTLIKQDRIPIVVINGDGKRGELYGKLLEDKSNSVKFYSLARFYEFAMQKVPLDVITKGWLLENIRSEDSSAFNIFKRSFDVFLSSLMLLISLPLWPFISFAIKLESRGPVMFRQERLGKDKKTFWIMKFRTMRVNGNNHAPTEVNDCRVTAVGDFLRRTRLDELPQAVNVLKGEMSFIGPRPERPELAEQLAREVPFYDQRNRVLPGMTGWDQVCGEYHSPSSSDTYKKIQYDLYYIKNRSVQLELKILLRTVRTILFREGR